MYSSDLIRSLYSDTYHIGRSTRKTLFTNGLWRPFTGSLSGRCHFLQPLLCPSTSVSYPASVPQSLTDSSSSQQPTSVSSHPHRQLRVATWNAFSIREKYTVVADIIISYDLDLLVVIESCHKASTDVSVQRSIPPGYSIIDRPRTNSSNDVSRGVASLSSTGKTSESNRLLSPFLRQPSKPLLFPSRQPMVLTQSSPCTDQDLHIHPSHSLMNLRLLWNSFLFTILNWLSLET